MKGRSHNNGQLRREAGIAIGPILFVIAILGVLAAAISASSGFFASSTSRQSAKLMAQLVVSRSEEFSAAIQKIRALGYSDYVISFEPWSGCIEAGCASCNSDECKVFTPTGGGLVPVPLPARVFASDYGATEYVFGFMAQNVKGITPDEGITPDGGWQLGLNISGVDKDVCVQINNLFGIDNPGGNPPTGDPVVIVGFSNVFTYGYSDGSPFVGKRGFCYHLLGSYYYIYII